MYGERKTTMNTTNSIRAVACIRFVLAGVLAPVVAIYCFAAYCVALLPLVIALAQWDDAQTRGRYDGNEGDVVEWIVKFMLWPWTLWKRLLPRQNVLASVENLQKEFDDKRLS